MNIKKELDKQLRREFSALSPDITKVIVWYIMGGTSRTFNVVYEDILKTGSVDEMQSDEEKDNFVYTVLLEMGRLSCQNTKLINMFRETIRKVASRVNMEEPAATPVISNAALITKHSPIISDESLKKRKFADEEANYHRKGIF